MVDEAANKGLSDFMYRGMETTPEGNQHEKDSTDNFSENESTQAEGAEKICVVRKMTKKVTTILSEAKKTLSMAESNEDQSTMTINEEVEVVEWAPAVFHAIRKMDGITHEMIEESLDTDSNSKQLFKAKESAGKSGSFMFSSFDRRFLIKTMNTNEQKVLKAALPYYLNHCRNNKKSLIAKIYGIYTVKMEDICEVHILLMGNLFLNVKEKISEFDLKGSIINREVQMPFTMKDCLKDVNLIDISKKDKFLRFRRNDMRSICSQILKDITFFAGRRLLDYSLLLITEKNPDFVEEDDSMHRHHTFKSDGNNLPTLSYNAG